MHAAFERALELSSFWDAELRKELPEGADVFDAHTHLGDDIDGMKGRLDELVGIMDAYGVSRGAADHRARRNRGPRRPRRELRGQGRGLLRHVRLEPRRPAGLLPADLARAGRLRLGLPLRAAAELPADRSSHGPRGRFRG